MPMRWRWPPENWCGKPSICALRKPDAVEQLGDGALELAAARGPVHAQRLRHDVAGRHARIERGERILEDDLHLRPQRAQLRLGEMGDVASAERMRAGGRLDQPQDRASDRRLAAAGLAHQPERLARLRS